MKKCLVAVIVSVLIGALLWVPSVARADAADKAQEELEGYVEQNLSTLEMSDFEAFCRDIGLSEGSVRQVIAGLIKGELTLSPRELLSMIWDAFASSLGRVWPALAIIVLISLLFNLLTGLTQRFLHHGTQEIVYFVCYGAVLLTVVSVVADAIRSVSATVTALVRLMDAVSPPLMTLMVAVGGNVTTSIFRPQLALCCTLVAGVIVKVVLPLVVASVVFAVVGNLSSSVRLDKLLSATRYLVGVILTVVFGLFTTYLAVAGIAGTMADTVSVRAARYVIGSYLPLIGGYISQGFDLVTASLSLIKNALGVYAVLAVLAVVLAPLAQLLALVVGLKLTAGLIEPIGDKRMASFVGSVAECMRSLVAAVAGVGFTFVVTLLLVMCSLTAVL